MLWILNAFSLNMLPLGKRCRVAVEPVASDHARKLAVYAVSAVGHETTAQLFSDVLGLPIPYHRATVVLQPGDHALVGQYEGPRLAEGATQLPKGAGIRWFVVGMDGDDLRNESSEP